MSQETIQRLSARLHYQSEAIKVSSDSLLRIEAIAESLSNEASPNVEFTKNAISDLKDIVYHAIRARAFISEANK